MSLDPRRLSELSDLDFAAQPADLKRLYLNKQETERHARIVLEHGDAGGDLWLEGLRTGRAESSGRALNAAREMGRVIKLFDLPAAEIRQLAGPLSTREMEVVQGALQKMREGVWK